MTPRARLPLLLSWIGVAFARIRPPPSVLDPVRLVEAFADAWAEGVSARLALCSSFAIVLLALFPRYASPLLLVFVLVASAASVPIPRGAVEEMPFVARRARTALSLVLKQQPNTIQFHSLGVLSCVTLHTRRIDAERFMWDAPVVAVGAFGKWHPLARIDLPSGRSSNGKQIDASGVLPPAIIGPIAIALLLVVLALVGSDSAPKWGRRYSARLVLTLVALFVIAAHTAGADRSSLAT